ncbi:unnamed protein product [Paramecium pentaurelia]|uniref:Tetratricopeptide repeat protein n=1 Tax=Paramecium pentaurelia TaxID=43138 RepID=A0A8S1XN01_9CILI|nr:unnamed protein product [Paramecium pentaurelia]
MQPNGTQRLSILIYNGHPNLSQEFSILFYRINQFLYRIGAQFDQFRNQEKALIDYNKGILFAPNDNQIYYKKEVKNREQLILIKQSNQIL